MQWTAELDALLNQCVFECGYDFTAASQLLLSRARQLHLVRADEKIELTSDECQVRWMAINPVVEEDDDGDHNNDGDDDDLYLHRSVSGLDDDIVWASEDRGPLDESELNINVARKDETRPVEHTAQNAFSESTPPSLEIPDGCPTLELSLSDADLDTLLASLPGAHEGSSQSDATDAAAKDARSASEMQWVLSFLTDPHDIAHRDAEAKNMLFDVADRSEDDNYQYFLQELNQANLMSPRNPAAKKISCARKIKCHDTNGEEISSEEEDSDDDWVETRKTIKASVPLAKTPTTSHKRRLTRGSHTDVNLPPPAPIRFPTRTDVIDRSPVYNLSEDNGEETDDNGLSALPRYDPPVSLTIRRPITQLTASTRTASGSPKLLVLSEDIGRQLRRSGEFKFP